MPGSGTQPSVRECESLFLDSIAAARQSIYIESQYFTNEALAHALASRLREPGGPEVVVVTPRECHGWIEQNTMCAFRDGVCRALRDADRYRRLRLVYPAASRARDVATFVHSKVMMVDDVLVRIGSANYSRRSMGVDTECDLAVDAGNDRQAQAGVRHIRDRLLAEHLGISVDELGRELKRAGSVRGLIDARDSLDRTLVRVDLPAECPPASEALRAAADPDKPIWFESSLGQLVPPVDATNGLRPFPIPLIPTIVLASAVASTSSALIRRREFQAFQDALVAAANLPSAVWVGASMVLVASLALIPLELAAVAAGVFFGAVRGGLAALLGSIVAAAIGYLAGRLIGPAGLARWISLRSYRSARQLGARGAIGVAVLRLASVASAASVHLICGAGRVPFWAYMAGTVIAITPAIAALSGLGALVRHTMLHPSAWNAFLALGTCLLLFAITAGLRTLLLLRQFAPSMSKHRARAEFG
jgi:uncharacterized membrane protein YdjX (TVP38/TMEM64 family)